MAQGNLAFPATGLDSFVSVDLANIWNVLSGGGTGSAPTKKRQFQIDGAYFTNQLIGFPLTALDAVYGTEPIKITIQKFTYSYVPVAVTGQIDIFATYTNAPPASALQLSHFFDIQGAGIAINVNCSSNTQSDQQALTYAASGGAFFTTIPLNMPPINFNPLTAAGFIVFATNNFIPNGNFDTNFVTQLLLEVEELEP